VLAVLLIIAVVVLFGLERRRNAAP
jgi:hypothetical protein